MSTTFLIFAAIFSTICAFAAARFARNQGRNVYLWAGATFILPAVLLFLMKAEVDREKQ
ncbi:MAG: hypothetical protein ACR2O4_12610 [Hyphomicrobiaceae bacterium]